MDNQNGLGLRSFIDILRRRGLVVLGCTLIACLIAFIWTYWRPPVYEASAILLVKPSLDTKTNEYNVLVAAERLAITYSKMLKGRPVLENVIARLGLAESPDTLADRLTVLPISDTQLIRLTTRGDSPSSAALLVNTWAHTFTDYIQELDAERYASSFSDLQEEMEMLEGRIEEDQLKVDDLKAKKNRDEAELIRLENLLEEYRMDLRSLQQDYQSLQLTITQLTNRIRIAETAQVSDMGSILGYSATTTLFVDDEYLIDTYSEMLAGRPILEAAISELGLDETPEGLSERVWIGPVEGSQLIHVRVYHPDKDVAAELADAIANTFVGRTRTLMAAPYADTLAGMQVQIDDLVDKIAATQVEIDNRTSKKILNETELARLETSLEETQSDYQAVQQKYDQLQITSADASESVVIAETAREPEEPLQRFWMYLAMAGALGLLIGIGLAFFIESLDDTLSAPDDIHYALGVNVLGRIGRIPKGSEELIVVSQPRSPLAEAFRILATNLHFASMDQSLHTVLITSPNPLEGKSVVAANLAAALAQKDLRVVVVDADLRQPRLNEVFGIDQGQRPKPNNQPGEKDNSGSITINDCLKLVSVSEIPSNPVGGVDPSLMRQVLARFSQEADMVIIDSPPILPTADAVELAGLADGVVLVLKSGQSRRQAARRALENLCHVKANLVGVVFNHHRERGDGYYYQNYAEREIGEKEKAGREPGEQVLASGEKTPALKSLLRASLAAWTRWGIRLSALVQKFKKTR
jgi:capsular exopolysaccharide synthesis family protein